MGVKVKYVNIDTVGPPLKYQQKLQTIFPDLIIRFINYLIKELKKKQILYFQLFLLRVFVQKLVEIIF